MPAPPDDAPMDEDLAALYQGLLHEHHAHPRNRRPLVDASHVAARSNPLCGDRVTLRLRLAPLAAAPAAADDAAAATLLVTEAAFEAQGCALAIASASLLTTRVLGASVADALALAAEVTRLLDRGPVHAAADRALLGELVALEGARRFPSRIGCAALAWETLRAALPAPERSGPPTADSGV